MIQGCGSGMVKPTNLDLPIESMRECEEAVKASRGDFESLFLNHIDLREQYEDCRIRHNALVNRIKDLKESADLQ